MGYFVITMYPTHKTGKYSRTDRNCPYDLDDSFSHCSSVCPVYFNGVVSACPVVLFYRVVLGSFSSFTA